LTDHKLEATSNQLDILPSGVNITSEVQSLTRRSILTGAGTAIAAIALAAPVIAAPAIEPDVCSVSIEPFEQFEAALAEYRAAALELVPSINDWVINRTADAVVVCGLTMKTGQQSVAWDGPGVYELAGKPVGGTCWQITRAPQYDSGSERWFGMSTGFKGKHEPEDWFCPERNLPKLVRKVRPIELTARERAAIHLSDYRRAMAEADPTITGWWASTDIETGALTHFGIERNSA
jgi:hypothetical protein